MVAVTFHRENADLVAELDVVAKGAPDGTYHCAECECAGTTEHYPDRMSLFDDVLRRRWDSARHLETEADIARYWEACLEEGRDDPAFIMKIPGFSGQ